MTDEDAKFLGLLIVAAVAIIVAAVGAHSAGEEKVRREAVRVGHAEYLSDGDGKPKFTWKGQSGE